MTEPPDGRDNDQTITTSTIVQGFKHCQSSDLALWPMRVNVIVHMNGCICIQINIVGLTHYGQSNEARLIIIYASIKSIMIIQVNIFPIVVGQPYPY